MKKSYFFLLIIISINTKAQTAKEYFVGAANLYINSKNSESLKKVDEGLVKYPKDEKLRKLKDKLKQKQQDDKREGEQENGNKSAQNNKQKGEEKDTPSNAGKENGEDNGKKGTGESNLTPEEKKGREGAQESARNLEKSRYDNILKALEKQEQNTQRQLMMGRTQLKAGSKEKDW